MKYTKAIVRKPGPIAGQGLTSAGLGEPDIDLLLKQHEAYVKALRDLGLDVTVLDAHPVFADAYFVEDTAVITPGVAVMTYPGAVERRGEVRAIEPVLAERKNIDRIQPPGTLEGGDVLLIENRSIIGWTDRTNVAGAMQLTQILEAEGYTCSTLMVKKGIHLKARVNYIGRGTLLLTEDMAKQKPFQPYVRIVVPRDEEYAANTLWVNDHLLVPAGFPGTKKNLEALGLPIIELDVSEVRKMDGGLTCLSLRY